MKDWARVDAYAQEEPADTYYHLLEWFGEDASARKRNEQEWNHQTEGRFDGDKFDDDRFAPIEKVTIDVLHEKNTISTRICLRGYTFAHKDSRG